METSNALKTMSSLAQNIRQKKRKGKERKGKASGQWQEVSSSTFFLSFKKSVDEEMKRQTQGSWVVGSGQGGQVETPVLYSLCPP